METVYYRLSGQITDNKAEKRLDDLDAAVIMHMLHLL